jgi:hypothetical protein
MAHAAGAGDAPSEAGSRMKNLLGASPEVGQQKAEGASLGVPGGVTGPSTPQSAAPGRADIRQDLEATLRNQGFVVEDDGQNVRLRAKTGGGKGSGLSASDIVRLAAELDGGILPPEKRIHCPKCDAVVPPGQAKCQWCGASMTQAG